MAIAYVWLIETQGDGPEVWFPGRLLLAAALAGAAIPSLPRRAEATAVSGAVLIAFGILAIFSIGLPLLVAGVLAIVFAANTREEARSG